MPPKVRATGSMTVTRIARPRMTKTTLVTVLFADLRGYTGLAEKLAPAQIVPLLDEFFAVLAAATGLHGGQVFHVAGDGMMAGFGVGGSAEEGARAALAAGHSMLGDFGALAERWRQDHSIETGIGIGMHTGDVALGLIGTAGQETYDPRGGYGERRGAAVRTRAGRRGAALLHGGSGARCEDHARGCKRRADCVPAPAAVRAARPERAARYLVRAGAGESRGFLRIALRRGAGNAGRFATLPPAAPVAELVDATDLKSVG